MGDCPGNLRERTNVRAIAKRFFNARRRQTSLPLGRMDHPDVGTCSRLCSGKPGDSAARGRWRISAILRIESQTVPTVGSDRARTILSSKTRTGRRPANRSADVPSLAKRPACRRSYRHHRTLAGRLRQLSDRVLVHLRSGSDRRKYPGPAHRTWLQRPHVSNEYRLQVLRQVSWATRRFNATAEAD